jgi:hypothetical protein
MRSQLAALRTLLMAWVNSLDDGRATTRASDR